MRINVKLKKMKKACPVDVCIDPKTGMLRFVKPGRGCPKGFMKKLIPAARKGVIVPPEDDDE